MFPNRGRMSFSVALLACAMSAACGDAPRSPLLPVGASFIEAAVTGSVGRSVPIDLPGDAWYDPSHSYVTVPDSEILSDVAEIEGDPNSQIVSVLCKKAGNAWVKVYATHGQEWYWKIYPLTCTEPELEDHMDGTVGKEFYFDVREDLLVANAYVTIPYAETISDVATTRIQGEAVYVLCKKVGEAWVRVQTSNGYWKIYGLTCSDHDQGGGG